MTDTAESFVRLETVLKNVCRRTLLLVQISKGAGISDSFTANRVGTGEAGGSTVSFHAAIPSFGGRLVRTIASGELKRSLDEGLSR